VRDAAARDRKQGFGREDNRDREFPASELFHLARYSGGRPRWG
jgi:hypothetical protein